MFNFNSNKHTHTLKYVRLLLLNRAFFFSWKMASYRTIHTVYHIKYKEVYFMDLLQLIITNLISLHENKNITTTFVATMDKPIPLFDF